ncbi:MAG: methionine--tRNA ligase [Pseudomonadota bacterium]
MSKRYYITTAISYPNGTPHIGHAYEALATDMIARFKRLDGFDVHFLTGTDEHGLKMLKTARDQGMSPGELADRNTPKFQQMVEVLGCSNDDFIRTTEPRHHEASRALWARMLDAGDIYKNSYAGWYSVRDEAYYADDEITTSESGVKLGPQGTPVEWVEEASYFFRLSAFQDLLLEHYDRHRDFIGPEDRRNEIISFVKGGLKDLSISRTTFDWGIKVPGDDDHVMYVWVDALTNYITAVGFPNEETEQWRYWPADLHVIGKDIVRFHAVYWPAFLMSAGVPLPKRVYAHGFLFNRGEKMSKSVGNVIDPFGMVDHYGRDQVRYFFVREVPFGRDGNYSHDAIVGRINADLANDLGNLAQRCLSMVAKNCAGLVPQHGDLLADDQALIASAKNLLGEARGAIDRQELHTVLNAIWSVVGDANRYFAGQEPWALKKTNPERMQTVLWTTMEVLRRIGLMIQPTLPEAGAKLLDLLGVEQDARAFDSFDSPLSAGVELPKPVPIFPRYVDEEDAEPVHAR